MMQHHLCDDDDDDDDDEYDDDGDGDDDDDDDDDEDYQNCCHHHNHHDHHHHLSHILSKQLSLSFCCALKLSKKSITKFDPKTNHPCPTNATKLPKLMELPTRPPSKMPPQKRPKSTDTSELAPVTPPCAV